MKRLLAITVGLIIVAAGSYSLRGIDVSGDVTHFLPEDEQAMGRLARVIASSDLNRMITLTVRAEDEATTRQAAALITEALASRSDLSFIRRGPDPELERAFYELYFPRRMNLLGADAESHVTLSPEEVTRRLVDLRARLGQPTGTFVREVATKDPLLLFVRQMEALRSSQGNTMSVVDGQFMADGWAVILLSTKASPFEAEAQRPIQRAIEASVRGARERFGALEVEQAGVHRIAIHSEDAIRADIQRVSTAGTVGMVLFLLLVFGSLRTLFVGTVPIALGFFGAVTTTYLMRGSIHGLTLAFGATLIGVAIDYVAHALNHHRLGPEGADPTQSVRLIWPALLIGALTTVVGLLGLGWTSLPGIQEIALFTCSGVLVALLATRYLMPALMARSKPPTRIHNALLRAASALLSILEARRSLLWLLLLGAIGLAASVPFVIEFQDDPSLLNRIDPVLQAEDERVRDRVARVDAGRLLVSWGDSLEQALVNNDRLADRLTPLAESGEVDNVRSLAAMLPSEARQRESHALMSRASTWTMLTDAMSEGGFVAAPFAPFQASQQEPFEALTLASFADTPAAPLVSPFVATLGDKHAVLTFVRSQQPAKVQRLAQQLDGVDYFDQRAFFADAYSAFRTSTIQMSAIGLLIVLLVIVFRYRRLRPSLAAFLPAALAAAGSVALLSLFGQPVHLMHVVTLLLVLSMGVDYGVFMVEAAEHEGVGASATVVSLLIACGSTVLSFGALAFSQNPAMSAMGLTAAVGVGLSLVLAPTAWVLSRPAVSQKN